MFKVLIVDDDFLVRNKLRSMIRWEDYGFTICGEAVNGSDAALMLEELRPHIVILDVSMPLMDGLELSAHIHARHREMKMIVLSSYDNFDYVRETMKNGALDYLLKHSMDTPELLNVLEKAKSTIVAETMQKKEMEMAAKKWEIISPAISQKYIKEWVLGINNNVGEIREYFEDFHFRLGTRNIVVVAMQLTNFVVITERYTNRDRNMLISSVTDLCSNVVYTIKNGSLAYVDQGRFVFLFAFENLRSESSIYSLLQNYIDKISNSVGKFLNIRTIFGHSDICNHFEEIPTAYERAVGRLENQLFQPEKRDSGHTQRIALSISQEKRLLSALEAVDADEVGKLLDEIFQGLRMERVDYNSIQMIVSDLVRIANKMAQSMNGCTQGFYDGELLTRERLKQCKKLEEIKECIAGLFHNLADDLQRQSLGHIGSQYVKEAVAFIGKSYHRDISLEDAAGSVGLSPSYFSKLFKDEVGRSFPEYLNSVRIEAAKNLISKGERKAKILYRKVGFNNYNYFIRVFKEVTGLTPLSFAMKKKRDG